MTRHTAVTRLGFTCFTLVRIGDGLGGRMLFPARVQRSRNAMSAFAS